MRGAALDDLVMVAGVTMLGATFFIAGIEGWATFHTSQVLQQAAQMADRSVVADGCLTTNTENTIAHYLTHNGLTLNDVYLHAPDSTPASYGTRALNITVGYDMHYRVPFTQWSAWHRYMAVHMQADQSLYVPGDGAGTSSCAGSVAQFAGTSQYGGSGGQSSSGSNANTATEVTSLTLTASPNPAQAGQTITLSGVANDASGAAPSGTQVTIAGPQGDVIATTGSQGAFSATETPSTAGTVTYTATAGTASASTTVNVTAATAAHISINAPSQVTVGQAFSIHATATDAYGEPVANGTAITIQSNASQDIPTTTLSSNNGSVTDSISGGMTEEGTFTITVKSGSAVASAQITAMPGPAQSVTLTAHPTTVAVGRAVAVSGAVFGPDHTPVANGTGVTLTSPSDPSGSFPVTSTSNATTNRVLNPSGAGGSTAGWSMAYSGADATLGTTSAPALQWTVSSAIGHSDWVSYYPAVHDGETYQFSVALSGQGTAWLNAWTGSANISGNPIHLTSTSQTAFLTITIPSGASGCQCGSAPQIQIVTPGTQNATVDIQNASVVGQISRYATSVTFNQAGTQTLEAQVSSGGATVDSAPVTITVTAGTATQVANFSASPNPVEQGASTDFTGTIEDSHGNPVGSGVTFTIQGGSLTKTLTGTTNSAGQFSISGTFQSAGSQTVTLAVGGTTLSHGSLTVSVLQTGADSLTASPTKATVTAGGSTTVVWTLTDSTGAPVANVPVTFTLSNGDSSAVTPTSGTTNAKGQVSVTVGPLTQAGTVTLEAQDTNTTNVTGTMGITVTPGAPTSVLNPVISPSVAQSTQYGGTVYPSITGTLVDAYGNPIPQATVKVTGGWDSGTTFTGTTTNQGTFDIALDPVTVGGPYDPTIASSDAQGSNSTTYSSTTLTVVKHLYQLVLSPSNGSASTPAGTPYGVTATLTEAGAPVHGASITFTVPSGDTATTWASDGQTPSPTGPTSITATTNTSGQVTVEAALEDNLGNQTIAATYPTNTTNASMSVDVGPNQPATVSWTTPSPDPVTAGHSFVTQGTLTDSYGLPVAAGEPVTVGFESDAQQTWTTRAGGLIGSASTTNATEWFTPTKAGTWQVVIFNVDGTAYNQSGDPTLPDVSETVNPGPMQYFYPAVGPANNTSGTQLSGYSWTNSLNPSEGPTNAYGTRTDPPTGGRAYAVAGWGVDQYGNAMSASATVSCTASNGGACPTLPSTSNGAWQNTGPFISGSYQLTYVPSSSADGVSSSPTTTYNTFTIPGLVGWNVVVGNGTSVIGSGGVGSTIALGTLPSGEKTLNFAIEGINSLNAVDSGYTNNGTDAEGVFCTSATNGGVCPNGVGNPLSATVPLGSSGTPNGSTGWSNLTTFQPGTYTLSIKAGQYGAAGGQDWTPAWKNTHVTFTVVGNLFVVSGAANSNGNSEYLSYNGSTVDYAGGSWSGITAPPGGGANWLYSTPSRTALMPSFETSSSGASTIQLYQWTGSWKSWGPPLAAAGYNAVGISKSGNQLSLVPNGSDTVYETTATSTSWTSLPNPPPPTASSGSHSVSSPQVVWTQFDPQTGLLYAGVAQEFESSVNFGSFWDDTAGWAVKISAWNGSGWEKLSGSIGGGSSTIETQNEDTGYTTQLVVPSLKFDPSGDLGAYAQLSSYFMEIPAGNMSTALGSSSNYWQEPSSSSPSTLTYGLAYDAKLGTWVIPSETSSGNTDQFETIASSNIQSASYNTVLSPVSVGGGVTYDSQLGTVLVPYGVDLSTGYSGQIDFWNGSTWSQTPSTNIYPYVVTGGPAG